jgi:hypothetical protein
MPSGGAPAPTWITVRSERLRVRSSATIGTKWSSTISTVVSQSSRE